MRSKVFLIFIVVLMFGLLILLRISGNVDESAAEVTETENFAINSVDEFCVQFELELLTSGYTVSSPNNTDQHSFSGYTDFENEEAQVELADMNTEPRTILPYSLAKNYMSATEKFIVELFFSQEDNFNVVFTDSIDGTLKKDHSIKEQNGEKYIFYSRQVLSDQRKQNTFFYQSSFPASITNTFIMHDTNGYAWLCIETEDGRIYAITFINSSSELIRIEAEGYSREEFQTFFK